VNLELLAVLLAGGSLAVSVAVLFVGWRLLRSTRRAEWAGDERLEILREQQERLRVMYQERNMLREELERLRSAMDEEKHLLGLPAPSEPSGGPERGSERPWWRRMFGG
jgi:hypothetical protein